MKPLLSFALLLMSSIASANSHLPSHQHIAITGYGEISVKPDIAILHLSVEHTSAKSTEAKAEVDKRFNSFLKGLETYRIKEENVVASRINVSPRYEYSQKERKQIHIGFIANRTIAVTVDQLSHLSDVMDLALKHQVNQVNHVEMASSKELALKQQAVELAIQNAKTNAKALAESFGASLGKVYSINAQNNQQIGPYGNMEKVGRMQMVSSDSGNFASSGKYLQDDLRFKATINVVFDLENNSK